MFILFFSFTRYKPLFAFCQKKNGRLSGQPFLRFLWVVPRRRICTRRLIRGFFLFPGIPDTAEAADGSIIARPTTTREAGSTSSAQALPDSRTTALSLSSRPYRIFQHRDIDCTAGEDHTDIALTRSGVDNDPADPV
ncbi:hypothetical protein QWJ34_20625 [Saccharibacillus sp. CPCC 101409]|uniref:hypothetical protein n=1 Tax=Saccharibacillus sp. CPCC 101409 TaxID=3058041 RepID=UPI0026741200|nr:hypothetical protein [Saccharibacillus sp. CPCC 101409]MDO3412180.1 hypothetical protein [Saccharibacillus sp. CPCC 101409]